MFSCCTPRVSAINGGKSGFTLVEVLVCSAILALVFGGILTAYIQGAYRAEWTGYSLTAQALAIQQIEQAKSAKWDTTGNEFTNLSSVTWAVLDLPISGTNKVWATNYTSVSLVPISVNPPVNVYMVRVDTQWPFVRKGQKIYFTNTVACYYAPD
jgi:prepilin-type N-terminal cleavage/methylation domain-containing protein